MNGCVKTIYIMAFRSDMAFWPVMAILPEIAFWPDMAFGQK